MGLERKYKEEGEEEEEKRLQRLRAHIIKPQTLEMRIGRKNGHDFR